MNFLKGLKIGIIGFYSYILLMGATFIWTVRAYLYPDDVFVAIVIIAIAVGVLVSFLAIFIGPLFYWVIEPLYRRYKGGDSEC